MVNVDHAVVIQLDELRRDHLHVPREHHEVDVMRVQQLNDPRLGFRLVFAADGNAEKRDAELLRDVFEIRMIRDDKRNFTFQRAFALLHEQIVEAVRRF